jgi:aerobic carbon-monoxide dehydrogenase large subunit
MLRGQARYLDDLEPPGIVDAAFVRSPYARARIRALRAPDGAPGLVLVLTAADLVGRARALPVMAIEDGRLADAAHPILAESEVRYAGQPVAAVFAESRAQAEDATEQVEVEYEELEPVVDPRGARDELLRWRRATGEVEGAFAAAAHVARGHYALPRVAAVPMEARGVIAAYDAAGDLLTVWASMQDPHRPLAQLAHALERAPERIRVIVPEVGGAFGSKGVIPVSRESRWRSPRSTWAGR